MLGLLLFVLKIIGIILLVLLALVFLLLAVVLLVPVRYKGRGFYYGKPEGSLRITWLLHLISVEAAYRETLEFTVRVLGFRLFKEKGKKAEEDLIEEPLLSAQELTKEMLDPKTEAEAVQAEEAADEKEASAENNSAEDRTATAGGADAGEDPVKELEQELHSLEEAEEGLRDGIKEEQKAGPSDGPNNGPSDGPENRPAGKKGLGNKIRNFFQKTVQRVRELIRRLQLSFRLLLARYRLIVKQKDELLLFLRDEENQKTFRLLKRQALKAIRHLLPGKLKGEITFGFEDPYITGQLLAGAAFFYPLYHKNIFITPVFDRQIIEGRLSFKGRIRMGTLLILGLRLLLHKNFRVLLKKFLNQGGN